MEIRRAAAVCFQLLFYVLIKGFCLVEGLVVGKNGVGMFRRQLFPVVRRPGLKDNWSPLRRAANIQRTGDLEEVTVVIERMQFGRVKKLTALFVADKRVAFPGIPQPFHHVEILIGNAIAQRVFGVFFAGKVLRRPFQRRGHHVPARAAVTEVIEAGKLARRGKGLAVGGG